MERLDADTLVKLAAADVTPVRQRTQFTCMATSMMMCLQANRVTCNEDEVNEVMGARAMRGAAWEDAIACAQHYGMKTVLMCPTSLTQIKRWTDMGVPVIIAWNPEKREWAHASVVFDVDDDNNVHVADPNIPNPDKTVRVVPEDEFYGLWAEKHSNGYLIRRTAMAVMPEITEDGRQKWASSTRKVMAKEFETMSMPELEKEVSKAFRGSKHNSKQMMLELPDGRLVMFSRSGRGPSAKTKIDIYKSEGGKPSPVKKDISVKSVADAVSKIKSNKTASMDEDAWSRVHSQMTKALASGIRGSRADSGDFWASHVTLPRDIAHGMYLQCGTQRSPRQGLQAYISVWTPMRGDRSEWGPLYDQIGALVRSAKSSVGRVGQAKVYDNDKATKLWIEVTEDKAEMAAKLLPAICKQLGPQIGKAVASHAASPEHMGHFANLSVHPKVQEIMDNNPWNTLELHPKVAEISVEASLLSAREIERALKRAGLNFEYVRTDGGAFMVWGLGPMLSDRADISLDHRGGAPRDATRWKAYFDGRDYYIESLRDLNKLVSAMGEKAKRFQEQMAGRAAADETTAMWDGLTTHASVTTATQLLPEDPTSEIVEEDFETLVERMMLAAKTEDDEDEDEDDKEAKFERGEDVPLSKMPKKLQDNAKNPPPSVQKVKEKIKSKKASVELKGDRLLVRMMDQDDLPPKGTVMAALDDQWVVTDVATVHNAATGDQVHGHALVALRESEFDKLAARAPSGMYGYTKKVERDCQASVRKLHRQAVKLARTAVRRDGKVADFWGVHSKRGRSKAARMLLAALEANHRLASEQGKTVPMDKEAADKEAAYGYYGFRAKTARRGLSACQAIREEAGIVAASLHHRRTNLHAKITGFLEMHSKKGKCAGSRLLYDAYPDSAMKFASATTEDQPNDVGWLLSWEPEN